MILTCPACDTKYVVKDGAIPPAGRQVRCASCKHSWHQDPEILGVGEESELAEQPSAAVDFGVTQVVDGTQGCHVRIPRDIFPKLKE